VLIIGVVGNPIETKIYCQHGCKEKGKEEEQKVTQIIILLTP
jgi:hypothetical protein